MTKGYRVSILSIGLLGLFVALTGASMAQMKDTGYGSEIVWKDTVTGESRIIELPGEPHDLDTSGNQIMWAFGSEVSIMDPKTGELHTNTLQVPNARAKQLYDGKLYYLYNGHFYSMDPVSGDSQLVFDEKLVNIDNLEVEDGMVTWNRVGETGRVYRADLADGTIREAVVPGLKGSEVIEGISGDYVLVRRGCILELLRITDSERGDSIISGSHSDSDISGTTVAYKLDNGPLQVQNLETGATQSFNVDEPRVIRLDATSLVYTKAGSSAGITPPGAGPGAGAGWGSTFMIVAAALVAMGIIGAVQIVDKRRKAGQP